MDRETLLMVADSDHDADMLYAVGMFVPDPFIYLRINGKCHMVLNDLEIGRARRQAPHCRVTSLSACLRKLRHEGHDSPGLPEVVQMILGQYGIREVSVPASFPHGFANRLRKLRIKVEPKDTSFFPEREFKNAAQVKKISAALMMAEVGLSEAIQALKASRVGKKGLLTYRNVPLTSERLRGIIDVAVLLAGGIAAHTIVAGGKQSYDPHEQGYGPLRAHQPIIIDIFPRSQKTGYFGDITRTVVKGRASEAVRKLYQTVARGQEVAFQKMRPQTAAVEVHRAVQKFFEQAGYKTGKKHGRMQGFFHGTGHGLGLEIHEAPRVGPTSRDTLQTGQVVTVEPGLYFPELGGVRLEDVALIGKAAPRNLTKFEKVLEV